MTASVQMLGPYAVVSHTPAYQHIPAQRLELRTHHNNVPFLVALILSSPGVGLSRRFQLLLIALPLVSATHVFDFILSVQWHYAFHNAGPYRVTDLRYLTRGFWASLDNPTQVAKLGIVDLWMFYSAVGRLTVPIVLWMILAQSPLSVDGHKGTRRDEARASHLLSAAEPEPPTVHLTQEEV